MEGDPPLEDPEVVLQVLSKIPQVDPLDPDLGVLSHLIMDLRLVEMDLLTTASKDLRLEEVGAVSTVEVAEVLTAVVEVLTATDLEAAEVAEVFAMDLLDLEVNIRAMETSSWPQFCKQWLNKDVRPLFGLT